MLAILGDEIKFTNGVISSRSGFQGDVSAYQISVPIQPGNSGGPLFDNNGNIVGITSSGVNRELGIENVNYAVKSTYLINLIESILDCSIIPSKTVKISNVVSDNVKLVRPYVLMIVCSSE